MILEVAGSNPVIHPSAATPNTTAACCFDTEAFQQSSQVQGHVREDSGCDTRGATSPRMAYVSDLGPSEVLRTVQSLQSGGLCGADWKKGDEFVE